MQLFLFFQKNTRESSFSSHIIYCKAKTITSVAESPRRDSEELTGSAKSQSVVTGTSGLKENIH